VKPLFSVAALLVLAFCTSAHASGVDERSVRFGADFVSGGTFYGNSNENIASIIGLDLRLGATLSRNWALMAQGTATLVTPHVFGAALAEYSPVDEISLGMGLGVGWWTVMNGGGGLSSTSYAAVPFRLTLHPTLLRERSGRGNGFGISAEVAPSYAFASGLSYEPLFAVSVMFGLGYDWY
jgi:hypothetical protein